MSQSVINKVYARIRLMGRGAVFLNKDFIRSGSRSSVDVALCHLEKSGKIRRLIRGLYDYPRFSDELGGELTPDLHLAAKAYARKLGLKIQPDGNWAANMLGLSTQIPARISYFTDGKSRQLTIFDNSIYFRHVAPGKLQPGSEITILLTCAIRTLGREGIDDSGVNRLKSRLTDKDRKCLLRDARYIEGWIYDVIRTIAEGGGE